MSNEGKIRHEAKRSVDLSENPKTKEDSKWFHGSGEENNNQNMEQMGMKPIELPGEVIEIKAKDFDHSDIKWYVLIGVFSVLLIIPPITWLLFPNLTSKPILQQRIRATLTCTGVDNYTNAYINKTFVSHFEDSIIQDVTLNYNLQKKVDVPDDQEVTFETEQIPIIETFKAIDPSLVENAHLTIQNPTGNEMIITANYKDYAEELQKIDVLKDYASVLPIQLNNYEKQKMYCSTEMEEITVEIPRD